ncbi:uncharacterized protein [Elaeis guineensis]|uniref:uncharacterized protein n=1 Tax=Elaeis guineensis var. tenera TaxID=51953 RepID=UPI003C6CD0FE
MNSVEWWIHFGTSAENLRHMAVRILAQMVSVSGYERNWSTFTLIHSKQRNRLIQKCLDDLVYVHYNLRLRLKCIQEEVQLKYTDPTLDDYADEDDDPIIGWLAGQQQKPELDEQDPLHDQPVWWQGRSGWIQSNRQKKIFHIGFQLISHSLRGHKGLIHHMTRYPIHLLKDSSERCIDVPPDSQQEGIHPPNHRKLSHRGAQGGKGKNSCTCTTLESTGAI